MWALAQKGTGMWFRQRVRLMLRVNLGNRGVELLGWERVEMSCRKEMLHIA
jgi:hypothetical protein